MVNDSTLSRIIRVDRSARWTALMAALCAVHCLLTPLLIGILPVVAVSRGFEWSALGLTVAAGTGVALLGPARRHARVLAVLALGAAVWTGSLMDVFQPLPEVVSSATGSLIFAAGMIWSARICRSGECDLCDGDDPDPGR